MTDNIARPVSVYAEANPNPESMKFVLNRSLLNEGQSVDYPSVENAEESPFAQALFGMPFVSRVFIASNFVTITKNTDDQWAQLIPEIRTFIKAYMEEERPVFNGTPTTASAAAAATEVPVNLSAEDAEISQKVIDLLENYVRPAVEQDGGNITFRSYNDGVVTVNLQGSCSGCPSATVTLKAGIENLLKRMLPEVREVVAEGVTL